MKKILYTLAALALCLTLTQCKSDYLGVSSPDKSDDEFVTSSVSEAFKTLSYCYATYRGVAGGGNYNWNDVSDCEYYPEATSNNGRIGYLQPREAGVDNKAGQFNNLYKILARCARVAGIIEQKDEFVNANGVNDWTQLYGEAWTLWAYSYLELVKHFGDVPFGVENQVVEDYALASRYDILDACIAKLKAVESKMYDLGEGGITAERMSRTFANQLIAECNLFAGGWQTVRTDVEGLYGSVQFEDKGLSSNTDAKYVRRTDWKKYYQEAQTYLRKVLGERKGTSILITSDDRSYANNPFQRGFQYIMDMQVSPESLYEVGNVAPNQSERPYSQGRPSDGATKVAAPCKVFAGTRANPIFYYTAYEDGDKRRDASVVITGSDGKGSEKLVNFKSGSRNSGGLAINKWDINKMAVPYVTACRKSGMNYAFFRVPITMLELAEVDAALGDNAEALDMLNQLRARAFGDNNHKLSGLSGEPLVKAVIAEYKRETVGEGNIKWAEIRTGYFPQMALDYRAELKTVLANLEKDGYHQFANGKVLPGYIWTKFVDLSGKEVATLTYDAAPGETNPALVPGWRGCYDYTQLAEVASVVSGTKHNIAVVGLFENLSADKIAALEADGYVKTAWAIDMVAGKEGLWDYNQLSGIELSNVPLYFHPIPLETIQQSKGKVTNGYGLPQQ